MDATSGNILGQEYWQSAKNVPQHHGKIWIESEFNKGSNFYFTLPKDVKLPEAKATESFSISDNELITMGHKGLTQ